jgi:uncharacterized protein YcbK (DUF882 family)
MTTLQKAFDQEQIKYFSVKEVLEASATKKYKEEEIPESILLNIIPTIKVLDEIREWYGFPIILNCTYRDKDHNKRVKGEKNSLHLSFNAIDFTINNKNSLQVIYNHLNFQDSIRHFSFLPKTGSMGLGLYDTFIHIDTRAILNRKAPARW